LERSPKADPVPEPEVEEAVESVDVGGVATGTGDPE